MQKKFFLLLFFLFAVMGNFTKVKGEDNGEYCLHVNCTQNIVTVYERDESGDFTVPKKAFVCSVGDATPSGTFYTSNKYEWRSLYGGVYGQYATRISGPILFHSVPYYAMDKSSLEYEEYNKLGETASMGCVRLSVKDAKWIFDYCPSGTLVEVYESDEPEPLKPVQPIRIDEEDEEKRGWDPTDPDEENPWIRFFAEKSKVELKNLIFLYHGKLIFLGGYEIEDRVYLPLYSFQQLLKQFPQWSNDTPLISEEECSTQITDNLCQTKVKLNLGEKTCSCTAYVYQGYKLYPFRTVAEKLGLSIEWNEKNNLIFLSQKDSFSLINHILNAINKKNFFAEWIQDSFMKQ